LSLLNYRLYVDGGCPRVFRENKSSRDHRIFLGFFEFTLADVGCLRWWWTGGTSQKPL
jgi:hypothetical protein